MGQGEWIGSPSHEEEGGEKGGEGGGGVSVFPPAGGGAEDTLISRNVAQCVTPHHALSLPLSHPPPSLASFHLLTLTLPHKPHPPISHRRREVGGGPLGGRFPSRTAAADEPEEEALNLPASPPTPTPPPCKDRACDLRMGGKDVEQGGKKRQRERTCTQPRVHHKSKAAAD